MFRKMMLVAVVILCSLHASAQKLPFGSYTIEDGLLDSVVFAMYQDSAGYLWIGIRAGLNRLEGLEFKTYTNFRISRIKSASEYPSSHTNKYPTNNVNHHFCF